jgi:plasmid maintenance system antidote protein VapI
MTDLTEVTRRFMAERGMSLRALARNAGYDPSHLSKVLRGVKPCGAKMASDLDAALDAGGEIARMASRPDQRAHEDEVGYVAPELADYFRGQLAGHYTADMYLGPRHLIPTVQTQAELIIRLTHAADKPVRRELLDIGAAYTAMLGWLFQDAGDLTTSAHWRDITLSMAHRAGDPQLVSYALTNKAMLAIDQGEGRAVIDYSQAALAGESGLSPKARVLALQHQAHGHAMTGDRPAADRLLDTAYALTSQVDDDYPWGNACHRTPHYVEVQRATCYGRTGKPQDAAAAADLWDQIIDGMPETARRDNAVFRTRQAAALAVVPDPERVTAIAAEAAGVVQATGSARLRRELLELPSHARKWAGTSAGRQLREVISSIA